MKKSNRQKTRNTRPPCSAEMPRYPKPRFPISLRPSSITRRHAPLSIHAALPLMSSNDFMPFSLWFLVWMEQFLLNDTSKALFEKYGFTMAK